MKSILYSSCKNNLNEIEYFVDEICEEFNLSNSLYGNILIAITESIKLLENYYSQGEITFNAIQNNLNFTFCNLKQIEGVVSFFDRKKADSGLDSDPEKSIFMISALSDDLIVDAQSKKIICVFKNREMEVELSKHRKDYLKKYLNQEVIVNA